MTRWCPPGAPSTSGRMGSNTDALRCSRNRGFLGPVLMNGQKRLGTPSALEHPSAALVSSKGSRKALKRVFKSYRKRLDQVAGSGLPTTVLPSAAGLVEAPLMSHTQQLVQELRQLTARLAQTADLERFLPEDPAPDNCVAPQRRVSALGQLPPAHTSALTLANGQQVLAPSLDWDEEAFASMEFTGSGKLLVCQGSKCRALGAGQVLAAVSALSANSPGIEVVPCKCVGKCKQGPAMRVRPQNQPCAVYTELTPVQLPEVFATHFTHAAEPQTAGDPAPACCVECKTHEAPQSIPEVTAAPVLVVQ